MDTDQRLYIFLHSFTDRQQMVQIEDDLAHLPRFAVCYSPHPTEFVQYHQLCFQLIFCLMKIN